jgi:hypothetical protein
VQPQMVKQQGRGQPHSATVEAQEGTQRPWGRGCSGGDVGPKSMQLLKAMRGQLGDASASRSVDAVAAAEGLGMDTTTSDFDRRLQDLVRAGVLRGFIQDPACGLLRTPLWRSSQNSNSTTFVNRSVRLRNTDPSRKNAD